MTRHTGVVRPGLLRTRTVRGEPYQVGERILIPVARIVSLGKARGQVGSNWFGGWAGGFVWVIPLAILEQTPEGERRIAVTDGEGKALRLLLLAAAAIMLGFASVRQRHHRLKRATEEQHHSARRR